MEKKQGKHNQFDDLMNMILFFIAVYFLFSVFHSIGEFDFLKIQTFNTVFISILLQALPFMLVGTFVSSFMHVFISDEFIVKIFPKKYGLGFITALFAGLLFPVCECAIVPVMTRLVKKGVALPIAITFMLSAPIINPIVIISTLYAFPGRPEIAVLRTTFGLAIALLVGIVLMFKRENESVLLDECENSHSHSHCDCSCHHNDNEKKRELPMIKKLETLFLHSGEEFFNVGKYLVFGAFMTSLIKVLVSKTVFINLGEQSGISLLIMMATAFLFSACSTSDAFIARSFSDKFSMGSVMGFLVFGPMMDVKNILMLMASFKKSFVLKLAILIFIINFLTLYFFYFLI